MLTLTPYNTRRNDIWDYFHDFEKKFFGGFDENFADFRTDIVEEDGSYVLKADLPGFQKEDINVDLNDNMLTISAEHTEEIEEKEKNYIRRERKIGSYKRSFDVSNIRTDGIEASYENGVLELRMPKLEIVEKEMKRIEVK